MFHGFPFLLTTLVFGLLIPAARVVNPRELEI
jgi:hypothetical protein